MAAALLELEARWVSPAAWLPSQDRQDCPLPLSPFTTSQTMAGRVGVAAPGATMQRPPCPPSFLPSGAPHSPGGGVVWEPGWCLQHRSRSWLFRRMPVRGEYTIAPKLQSGRRSLGSGCRLSPTPGVEAHSQPSRSPSM